MSREKLKQLVANINVWKRGSQRAPHKPLLLLYALGRCVRGESREVLFEEVDQKLRRLLIEFGPSRKSQHPEYPFVRLVNDGLWILSHAEGLEPRMGNTDAKKSELLRHRVSGGLPQWAYNQLREAPQFLVQVALDILEAHFPSSVHEDIAAAVGLPLASYDLRRPRDPAFRDRVLSAYGYRCAVCDFDVRIDQCQLALEAAHIKWHQAGGPDTEQNGFAFCSPHHKLFDRGAFTVSDELRIRLSRYVHGTTGFDAHVGRFHGGSVNQTVESSFAPDVEFLRWHESEVFRGPARG